MAEKRKVTRREFLQQATGAAAVVAAGMWGASAPASALGANDRINIGVIGCGGQGTGHLRELVDWSKSGYENIAVIGVCDIYEPRKERAKEISGAKVFHDYHDLLEMPDLNAVLIGTPDHWHSRITIDAMEAGKDVYCEKPMTRYWYEAKEVAQVQARTGRVVQVGAQGSSSDLRWQANRLIREGAVGKLLWSQGGYCRNSTDGEWNWWIDPAATPQNLDWDRFLGPALKRPFDPERFFRFRKYWDYSGGVATDLFYHSLTELETALGPEFPCRVSAAGGIYIFPDREVPDTFEVIIDYPTNHTVLLVSSMGNRQGVPELIRGHEATLTYEGDQVVVTPEDEFKGQRTVIRVNEQPRKGHKENWLECIRTRGTPHCDAQKGYRIMVAIALSVEAYRQQKTMHFDPVKEELIG
jgi:predicted dehydrogenase